MRVSIAIAIGLLLLLLIQPSEFHSQTNIDGCNLLFEKKEQEILVKPSLDKGQVFQGLCRMKGISGFELESKKAEIIFNKLGIQNTESIYETVLLVQRYPKGFYYHSNFVLSKGDFPAKVSAPFDSNLEFILSYVLFDKHPEEVNRDLFIIPYENYVKFLFFEDIFTGEGPSLQIGDLKEFSIVDRSGKIIKFKKKNRYGNNFMLSIDIEMSNEKQKDCTETNFGDIGSIIDHLVEIVSCGILPE